MFLHQKIVFSVVILTSFLHSSYVATYVGRCHPHRFFLLCQSGGFAALLLPYLGGVASKVIFTSLLFFISVVLPLCVAWAVTLTGFFFFVRAEGLRPYCFLIWEGWHQRWSSSLCSTFSYALHWYWSIWHGLLGYIWFYIFVVALHFDGQAVACDSNFNGQCSIPPLDKGLSYSQLQFWSKKLPWTPSPPGWVCVCVCTFSKEVKPVHVFAWFTWWSFWQLYWARIYIVGIPFILTWCIYLKCKGQLHWARIYIDEILYFDMMHLVLDAGGQGLQWWPCLTKLVTGGEAKSDQLRVPATSNMDMVIKLCHYVWLVLLGFLVSSCCFKLKRNIFFHDFGTWCLSFC